MPPKRAGKSIVKDYSMNADSLAKLDMLCEADGLPASTMIRWLINQEYKRRVSKQKRTENANGA